MANFNFPDLTLSSWRTTRDSLHHFSRVLGKIRQALTPHLKNWWHVTLRAAPTGIHTGSIPAGPDSLAHAFDLRLDLTRHLVVLSTDRGDHWESPLPGHSTFSFGEAVLHALSELRIRPEVDPQIFQDKKVLKYQEKDAQTFLHSLVQIDLLLKQFRGELREETSEVQLFTHHFDLSLTWFSGRKVPNADLRDPENADEQMTFGFSTGDEEVPNPYFYITAYPLPAELLKGPLSAPASWHQAGWKGALLPYAHLVNQKTPEELLLGFLRRVQKAGAELMIGD